MYLIAQLSGQVPAPTAMETSHSAQSRGTVYKRAMKYVMI